MSKTDEELNVLVNKYATSPSRKGYEIVNGFTMPLSFKRSHKEIEDLEIYDDDIWVCTFPKSGTTWAQEMIWCICNNLNFDAAMEDLDLRFVFLEFSCIHEVEDTFEKRDLFIKSLDLAKNMKRPRFIKTHLPWELLPKQIRTFEKRPKIIHVARNPMDTCISYCHFLKFLGTYTGDFQVFMELFLNHKIQYSPYHKNILGYWNRRQEPNILFIKFEDMKTNLSAVVDSVAEFLNVLISREGKRELLSHLSFDSMRKNETTVHAELMNFIHKINVNHDTNGLFMRNGKAGEYRSEMSDENINKFKPQLLDELEKAGLVFFR